MFGKKDKHVDQEVFAIFDSKSQSYQQPIFAINQLTIIREIEQLYKDPAQKQNFLVTNAEDFSLFKIGEYDRRTAKFDSINPTHVVSMHEIKAMVMASQTNPTLRDVSQ